MRDLGVCVAQRCGLQPAPPPSQYHRHREVVEPVAHAYAGVYESVHGWPVTPEGMETFISDTLEVGYCVEPIEEGVLVYARYDPRKECITTNERFAPLFQARPDLFVSFHAHEVGHVVLRHEEALSIQQGSLFEEPAPPFLNHPRLMVTDWGDDTVKDAIRLAWSDPAISDAVLSRVRPDRCEPEWMYRQAQAFAGAFVVPEGKLLAALPPRNRLASWAAVSALAAQFGCSVSMMGVRLQKLGIVHVEGRMVKPLPETRQGSLL